jgi:hypothetical protein
VLDAETGRTVKELEGFKEVVNCLAISSTGYLAVGCGGHLRDDRPTKCQVSIVEIHTGKVVAELE